MSTIPLRKKINPRLVLAWRPIFDRMIMSKNEIIIPAQDTPYTVGTLHVQACECLGYLSTDAPDLSFEQRASYSMLRQSVSFRKELDTATQQGLLRICWKPNRRPPGSGSESVSMDVPKIDQAWREKLVEWINEGQGTLLLQPLSLTEDDLVFVNGLLIGIPTVKIIEINKRMIHTSFTA